jgi:hypothetical protein
MKLPIAVKVEFSASMTVPSRPIVATSLCKFRKLGHRDHSVSQLRRQQRQHPATV